MRDALGKAIDGDAREERDEARSGWAEQTADAARLRIALQESQRQLVQAHEDIDVMRGHAERLCAEREELATRARGHTDALALQRARVAAIRCALRITCDERVELEYAQELRRLADQALAQQARPERGVPAQYASVPTDGEG